MRPTARARPPGSRSRRATGPRPGPPRTRPPRPTGSASIESRTGTGIRAIRPTSTSRPPSGGFTSGTGGNFLDTGGLWRLRWDDIEDPTAGGTLTLLLDGSETPPGGPKLNKIDNLTIDTHGNALIQEDPGNNNHLARVVAYRIADGRLAVLARFDEALFRTGSNPAPLPRLTTDEESSGIVDAEPFLGSGTFILDVQAHTAKGLPAGTGPGTVEELVDRGQLLLLQVDDWAAIYGG